MLFTFREPLRVGKVQLSARTSDDSLPAATTGSVPDLAGTGTLLGVEFRGAN